MPREIRLPLAGWGNETRCMKTKTTSERGARHAPGYDVVLRTDIAREGGYGLVGALEGQALGGQIHPWRARVPHGPLVTASSSTRRNLVCKALARTAARVAWRHRRPHCGDCGPAWGYRGHHSGAPITTACQSASVTTTNLTPVRAVSSWRAAFRSPYSRADSSLAGRSNTVAPAGTTRAPSSIAESREAKGDHLAMTRLLACGGGLRQLRPDDLPISGPQI